jgi:tetratricopeptide (TPR) repeat protein
MKGIIIITALLLAIPALKAQKKEIRKAQQEVRAGNLASAASYLSQAKRIFAAADQKTRSEYYVVEAEMRLAEKELDAKQIELVSQSLKLANSYEVTSSLQDRISQVNEKIKSLAGTIAAGEMAKKNYSNAAALYKTAYQSSQDPMHLLEAARCFLLAKEYDDAYKSYSRLYQLGYTNARTQYVATNLATNKKEAFASTSERDNAIADGLYRNPEIITTNSKLPEILRGITVAAIPLDKKYEAMAIIASAMAKTPEDKMLLNQVSHLYLELEARDKYNSVVDKLIKETPNDPNLYYNFAVTSAQNNDLDRAKKLYKKALQIDPNYINAKVNLTMLLLDEDDLIKDKLNELGTSETDNERYEKLIQKRINLCHEVLPYIESIVKSQPRNEEFVKQLKDIYSFIGNRTQIAVEEKIDE